MNHHKCPRTIGFVSNKYYPSVKLGIYACISSRITTVIQVVRDYWIVYNWYNEPFAVSQYKAFILRHAWLNLWDERMTTGRIDQVAIFEFLVECDISMILLLHNNTPTSPFVIFLSMSSFFLYYTENSRRWNCQRKFASTCLSTYNTSFQKPLFIYFGWSKHEQHLISCTISTRSNCSHMSILFARYWRSNPDNLMPGLTTSFLVRFVKLYRY